MRHALKTSKIFIRQNLHAMSGPRLIHKVKMALTTAKICQEKGEKRVCYPVEPFDKADCSGFSVLKDMANLSA